MDPQCGALARLVWREIDCRAIFVLVIRSTTQSSKFGTTRTLPVCWMYARIPADGRPPDLSGNSLPDDRHGLQGPAARALTLFGWAALEGDCGFHDSAEGRAISEQDRDD